MEVQEKLDKLEEEMEKMEEWDVKNGSWRIIKLERIKICIHLKSF